MLKKLVQDLKKQDQVIAAYLFGSHGTSKETPLSDIDICVFTKNTDSKTILQVSSFGTEKIDLSIFDTLPIYVKPEVFKGKPLFVKNKLFVAEKYAHAFREYQDYKKYEQQYWETAKKKFTDKK